jgi:hypothetical protein
MKMGRRVNTSSLNVLISIPIQRAWYKGDGIQETEKVKEGEYHGD